MQSMRVLPEFVPNQQDPSRRGTFSVSPETSLPPNPSALYPAYHFDEKDVTTKDSLKNNQKSSALESALQSERKDTFENIASIGSPEQPKARQPSNIEEDFWDVPEIIN